MSINKKNNITNRNINNKSNQKINDNEISRESLKNTKIEDLTKLTNNKDKNKKNK